MIADYKSTLHKEWESDQVLNHRPLNFLKTDTEKSEHKGFAQLLKGCFAAVRNPLAHEPRILWDGEEDAADYFTLISLLHRRLDQCVRVSFPRH